MVLVTGENGPKDIFCEYLDLTDDDKEHLSHFDLDDPLFFTTYAEPYLEEKFGKDWYNSIDLVTYNQYDPECCVLGQLAHLRDFSFIDYCQLNDCPRRFFEYDWPGVPTETLGKKWKERIKYLQDHQEVKE